MRTIRIYRFFIALPLLTLAACANPGTPMGGPKDETPPVVQKSTPLPNAIGYKKKEVSIEFDELIQLKDVNQKLVVSPPLNKQPSVVARGNKLEVLIDEDLQENTTYTFDFADAVSDNNEGNVVPDFRFSFSTGEIVDSMSISGNLFQAGDLAPVSGALVFIHKNLADSAFHTLVPIRLSKTDVKGRFSIQNVAPGSYKLYALEDANRNYKYDQPGERIAWLDSLVVPSFEYRAVMDSLAPDSIVPRQVLAYTPDSLELFMFAEDQPMQYIVSDARKLRARIDLVFKRKVERFDMMPLDEVPAPGWSLFERSIGGDSISLWLNNSEMYGKDTLKFAVSYQTVDSLKLPIMKQDTLAFYFFEVGEKKKRKKDEVEVIPHIELGDLKSNIDVFGSLSFQLPNAPVWFNASAVKVYELVDSIKTEVPVLLEHDTLAIRRFRVLGEWEAGKSYQLEADSASFRDVYGWVNKSVLHKFNVRSLDSYGTAYVTVTNPALNWVIEVLNSKNVVTRSAKVAANGKMAFKFLQPAEYMFRILVDANNNGKWDSGNYLLGQQPESVIYYPEKVAVRANWDHEVKWDPATFEIHQFVEKFRKGQKQTPRR